MSVPVDIVTSLFSILSSSTKNCDDAREQTTPIKTWYLCVRSRGHRARRQRTSVERIVKAYRRASSWRGTGISPPSVGFRKHRDLLASNRASWRLNARDALFYFYLVAGASDLRKLPMCTTYGAIFEEFFLVIGSLILCLWLAPGDTQWSHCSPR